MQKTKREKALEKDIQQAVSVVLDVCISLELWIKMSSKMGRNPQRDTWQRDKLETVLATLDYQPMTEDDYMYSE